jgi:hypothetical protein
MVNESRRQHGAVHAVGCRRCGPETVLRFQSPLIKPGMQFSSTRLSEIFSSSGCQRCRVPRDGSIQPIHVESLEIRRGVSLSATAMLSRFLAQKQRQSFANVVINLNLLELARRVAHSKVGAPTAHHLVELVHEWPDGFWQTMSGSRDRFDSVANTLHRPLARPLLQIAFASVFPGLHLLAVEPEKVEALPPIPDIDHFGFGRMERQPQATEDDLDTPEGLVCLRLRPAQQDGIVGISDQLTQLATAVFPEPIQLVKHYVRQYA